MRLELKVRFDSQRDAELFWKISVSEAGMKLFSGFGMVPGINDVQQNSDGTNRIVNSDGSFHRERVIEKSEAKFLIEMDQFQAPSGYLFAQFNEEWLLALSENTITRTFIVVPKNRIASVINALVLRPQLKIAMKRNMTSIGKAAGVGFIYL